VTVTSCTLTGNSAAVSAADVSSGYFESFAQGGAIAAGDKRNGASGTVTVTACILSGNSAAVTASDSAFIQVAFAEGGGLFNRQGGTMTVSGCTLSGNSAALSASADGVVAAFSGSAGGGGVFNDGVLLLDHGRDTGNSCVTGADLFNDRHGVATLRWSTVGVLVNDGGTVTTS
jgi:hypothetical protein